MSNATAPHKPARRDAQAGRADFLLHDVYGSRNNHIVLRSKPDGSFEEIDTGIQRAIRTARRGGIAVTVPVNASVTVDTPKRRFARGQRPSRKASVCRHTENAIRKIPNAFQQVTKAIRKIPNAFQQVTKAIRKIPNAFQQVTNAIRKIPNASQQVTKAIRKIPNASRHMVLQHPNFYKAILLSLGAQSIT